MNTADIVILVFLGIGAYYGYKKGLLMGLISLSSFFIAVVLGFKLLDLGVTLLSQYLTDMPRLLPILSFAIIFIGVIIGLNFLGKTIKQFLDMTLLGKLDDLAGAVTGIVKWALFISIFIWVTDSMSAGLFEETSTGSYLFGPVSSLAPGLFGLLSDIYPSIMDIFENSQDFIQQEEQQV